MSELSSRFTPLDDDYETCEKTNVTLAIYHIDPDVVTSKLCLKPNTIQKIGVPRTMPSGVVRIGKMNSWLFSSENELVSKDLRRHLDWILDKIEPISTQLIELQQIPKTRMALRCVWWSAYGEGGPTLWPEQMGRIAKLNLECTFSFSWYGDYGQRIPVDQLLIHPDTLGGGQRQRN
jgi:hypothetical protein